jgi:hypothetical protein
MPRMTVLILYGGEKQGIRHAGRSPHVGATETAYLRRVGLDAAVP